MTRYHYPESGVISEVDVREADNGSLRAFVHAKNDVSEQVLHDAMVAFEAKGWQVIPETIDDKPALSIRGFSRDSQLLEEIKSHGWAKGPELLQKDSEVSKFSDKVKKRSLQASGAFYAVGDAAFFARGFKKGTTLDKGAGIFYALPTPVLWAYGSNDQAKFEVHDLAKKMKTYLAEEHVNLPESCSLDAITADHKKGLIKSTQDLFARYPSEFMSACYGLAGACLFIEGAKYLAKGKPVAGEIKEWLGHLQHTNPQATKAMAQAAVHANHRLTQTFNVGVGVSTMGAGAIGTFVNEKAKDPDAPAKTGMAGLWEWVQERPLAVTGAALMVSTLLHAASASMSLKSKVGGDKETGKLHLAFVAASLIAEILVTISSKGHGDGVVTDKSVDSSVIALAAESIFKQPEGMQEDLVQHMGRFLGRPDVLAMRNDEVCDMLRKQVEVLKKNPWAQAHSPATIKDKAASSPAEVKTSLHTSRETARQTAPHHEMSV